MSRNGSGTYTAPSNSLNPAVDGTTIDTSDWNDFRSDMETAMSASIAKDGQTTTTARVPFAAGISTDTITEVSAATGVTADGTLLKDGGVNIAGALASSGQIVFPATQNASSNANTLDDYEEGTWTPADGSGAGLSFSNPLGRYTKIGRVVFCECSLTYPSTADGSAAIISGLPFANNATVVSFVSSRGNAATSVFGVINTSVSTITIINSLSATVLNSSMSTQVFVSSFHYTV